MDWDPTLERLYGLPEGTFGGRFEDWVACIHPEDRDEVLGTLEETLRSGGPHHVLYRTQRPDGSVRWIEGRGRLLRATSAWQTTADRHGFDWGGDWRTPDGMHFELRELTEPPD